MASSHSLNRRDTPTAAFQFHWMWKNSRLDILFTDWQMRTPLWLMNDDIRILASVLIYLNINRLKQILATPRARDKHIPATAGFISFDKFANVCFNFRYNEQHTAVVCSCADRERDVTALRPSACCNARASGRQLKTENYRQEIFEWCHKLPRYTVLKYNIT